MKRQWWVSTLIILTIGLLLIVTYHYMTRATTVAEAMAKGDYTLAARLLEIPATPESGTRLLMRGNLYYVGLGVQQNYSTAATLFRQAAMLGNPAAQHNLALIYHHGMGQPADKMQATAWFLLADSGGVGAADAYLRQLSGSMNPNKVQEAHSLKEKLARAIEAGEPLQ